jgi:hypothetical protein
MGASKKHFSKKPTTQQVPIVDFSVDFDVDGEATEHHFTARPAITYGDMVALKKYENDSQGAVLPFLDRIIRRSLRNDDGVPLKWTPVVKAGEFTTPGGEQKPVTDLDKYTAFTAGSSRRRWAELIESDDAVVDFETVMSLFEHLAEQASADRPTERSQRS